MLGIILLAFSLVFFILAGLNVPAHPRFQWIGWGLAFLVVYYMLAGVHLSLST